MISNFLLSKVLLVCTMIFIPFWVSAQVYDDFESNSLVGWYSEGDGNASLSSTVGNPGSSLRIADNATGDINYGIAPSRYLGNWLTNLSLVDSISMDVYVQSTSSDTIAQELPVFQLSGPGGRASALLGLDLPRNTWIHLDVLLDSTQWTIEEGTWEALLKNITLFRVRAEYIFGNENVYLDNIQISVSPERNIITNTLCSSFEDNTYDGWNFIENGALSIDSIHGNPGIGIGLGDIGGDITQAIAPPKYQGDWSSLLDSGYLSFDLKVNNTSGGSLYEKAFLVKISGNGAVAEVLPPDSVLNLSVNQWHTYSFLIDSSAWNVSSGSWDSLIVSVEEIRLELEFISGVEVASFDNFCLVLKQKNTTSLQEFKVDKSMVLFPNPAQDYFTLLSPQATIESIALYDFMGRLLPAEISHDGHEARVRSRYRGLAIVKVQTAQGKWVSKVKFE